MVANISGVEGIVGLIASGVAIVGSFAVVVRWLLHNAIGPLQTKVAEHDTQISTAVALGNSTNIKVSRMEGYFAGMGKEKLPEVDFTVEKPLNGRIVEEPLIKE